MEEEACAECGEYVDPEELTQGLCEECLSHEGKAECDRCEEWRDEEEVDEEGVCTHCRHADYEAESDRRYFQFITR